MKILITGGSGFIGTNLIDYYLKNSAEVLNVDINPPRNKSHDLLWKKADIRDMDCIRHVVSEFQPEFVLHMAAKADLSGKSIDDYNSNTTGVKNVIEVCKEVKSVKKVIFASTMLVCRAGYLPKADDDYCPPNLYGESKVIGEKLIKVESGQLNYDWVIIRPTSIWGPWFGPTYRGFFEMIMKGRYFNFTGKMANKTYGFIGNTVYQIDKLLMSDLTQGKTFYLGDYVPTNIKEWANEISKEINSTVITVPRSAIWLTAKVGDLFKYFNIRVPMNSFRYKNMTTDNVVQLEETKKLAPLTLFSRAEGNILTIQWMNEYYFLK